MTEWLQSRIPALCAAGLFTAAVMTAAPGGRGKKLLRLVCSLFLLAVLLQTAEGFDYRRLAEELSAQKVRGEELTGRAAADTQRVYALCIQEKTEAYIWNKAREAALSLTSVEVSIVQGEEYPYPERVRLYGSWSEEQRQQLTRVMEGELGIPRERQEWYVGDGRVFPQGAET